ncbi:MAG: outer rane biosis protein BamB, partial [Verrucomicrobiales bacterium]|nr:outer rane biosis protein BamB [Verrucomicrobiales bacterium]
NLGVTSGRKRLSLREVSGMVGRMIQFVALVLLSSLVQTVRADDWPQWLGPKRDGVWRETGIIDNFSSKGADVQWRVPVGAGYSGPAVANGRIYVTDRQLATGAKNPSNPFQQGTIAGTERVLCFNEKDGKMIWQHEYDCPYTVSYPAGPRTTPTVYEDRVYTLGTEGNLICFEAAKGTVLWSKDFKKEFGIPTPLWGFAGHPLIDGNKLICLAGGSNSVAVAFDKLTGKELWRALGAKEPGYAPPTMIEAGGKRQLILWNPESINSLNPETGSIYWTEPFKVQMGLSVSTPRQAGDLLLVTSFYNGSRMLKLDHEKPAATMLWRDKKNSERDTDGLHSIISTPVIDHGYIYGVCSYGQLRCLKADTGERVWETLSATTKDNKEMRWGNAFIVPNGDRFFIFNELGDLIIAKLTSKGYDETSRAHILEPSNTAAGRDVVWTHPAFANHCAFIRNDKELVCVNLGK